MSLTKGHIIGLTISTLLHFVVWQQVKAIKNKTHPQNETVNLDLKQVFITHLEIKTQKSVQETKKLLEPIPQTIKPLLKPKAIPPKQVQPSPKSLKKKEQHQPKSTIKHLVKSKNHSTSKNKPKKILPKQVLKQKQTTLDKTKRTQTTNQFSIEKPKALPISKSHKSKKLNDKIKKERKLKEQENLYKKQVIALIEQHKFFPKRAKKLRRGGVVGINFTLNANGSIQQLEVIHSSGHSSLKKAAMKAVKLAGVFPAFPNHSNRKTWTFKTNLEYKFR